MTASIPSVLALAYYDGATEGFFDGMGDDRTYFFKVVAWDQNQDRRLYLLGKVDRVLYVELLGILAKTHEIPTGPTWTPAWTFGHPKLERRADSLVAACRLTLESPAFLALGEDLTGAVDVVRPNAAGLISAIALAREDKPGDLAEWMAQGI